MLNVAKWQSGVVAKANITSRQLSQRSINQRIFDMIIWRIENNIVSLPKIKLTTTMRAVIQRVSRASVTIEGSMKSQIGWGFLILLGICEEDTEEDMNWLVKKIANLRVFDDEAGVMNRSIQDISGEALVVSQFTLYASYKKGNRPSWFRAGSHEHSIPLYEAFCSRLSEAIGKPVGTGEFGADMKVELLNDGPVTICMDTKNKE
jgi:D-tyrosyl-tRNA(Tyr) deacylase